MITLVKVRLTCPSVPSQWDAWDAEGRYFYLRYRFGRATVDQFPSSDVESWPTTYLGGVAAWEHEDRFPDPRGCFHGWMSLREFCEHTGLQLADGADIRERDWNDPD